MEMTYFFLLPGKVFSGTDIDIDDIIGNICKSIFEIYSNKFSSFSEMKSRLNILNPYDFAIFYDEKWNFYNFEDFERKYEIHFVSKFSSSESDNFFENDL